MRRPHTYTNSTRQAAELFGTEVARARRVRHWTAAQLAERAGISRTTLYKIESGDLAVALGTAFEVATLLNIPLYGATHEELPGLLARSQERLALLPERVRQPAMVDNAF